MSRNSLLEAGTISEVWLNGWVFVCELSVCGFKSRCCHSNKKVFSNDYAFQKVLRPDVFQPQVKYLNEKYYLGHDAILP